MASRNGANSIERQLRSVLAQSRVQVLLLVRDDDSTDSTREIVTDFVLRGEPVRLLDDHTSSGSASGNFFKLILALDVAENEYVALSDQDDVWSPEKLARAVTCLEQDGASAYSSSVDAVWQAGRSRTLTQNPFVRYADYLFEGAGQGCTFVLTAAFFSEVQRALRKNEDLLHSIHYHDWIIYAVARALGRRWYFDKQVMMDYLQHSGNDTGARNSGGGVLRRLQLIRQGWYCRQVNAVADLVLAVNGEDQAAKQWRAISSAPLPDFRYRLSRLGFVARHGRRRLVDRLVLVFAVLAGYL